MATTAEDLSDVELMDLILHNEINEEGECRPSPTVYFHTGYDGKDQAAGADC